MSYVDAYAAGYRDGFHYDHRTIDGDETIRALYAQGYSEGAADRDYMGADAEPFLLPSV